MTKYKYAVVVSFRNLNDDVIIDYCETENEAITKMEETEDYRDHAKADSPYGEIDGIRIYKIERITL